MRLAVKNKEEGTELFKGGNFRSAAARYEKALVHCAKFFDLGPDDETEVEQLNLSQLHPETRHNLTRNLHTYIGEAVETVSVFEPGTELLKASEQ